MGLRPSAFGVEYVDVALADATTTSAMDSFDGGVEALNLHLGLDGTLGEAMPLHGRSHDVCFVLPKYLLGQLGRGVGLRL